MNIPDFMQLPSHIITENTAERPCESAWIYGAGGRGIEAADKLRSLGVNVLGFLDNNVQKHGSEIMPGLKCHGIDMYLSGDYPVVIASTYEYDIFMKIELERGRKDTIYYYRPESTINIPYMCVANISRAKAIRDSLADEESQYMYTQLYNIFTFCYWGGAKQSPYQQYDHPLVHAEKGDTILDVGGYTGDTAAQFLQQTNNTCKVISFEPSRKHYAKYCERLAGLEEFAEVLPFGTWSHTASLTFNTDFPDVLSGSHRVDPNGEETIDVIGIDSLVAERSLEIDMIKMDIEGSELQSLIGAKETIARQHPKLQISIYHKPSDLWEIKEYIDTISPGYTYYAGHHSNMHTETVLYGIYNK